MELFKIFNTEDQPDYSIDHIFEAFEDILKVINAKSPVFSNIAYGTTCDGELALRYTVDGTGKEIIKLFNKNQGLPELKADIITWLFSMLDAAVNIF